MGNLVSTSFRDFRLSNSKFSLFGVVAFLVAGCPRQDQKSLSYPASQSCWIDPADCIAAWSPVGFPSGYPEPVRCVVGTPSSSMCAFSSRFSDIVGEVSWGDGGLVRVGVRVVEEEGVGLLAVKVVGLFGDCWLEGESSDCAASLEPKDQALAKQAVSGVDLTSMCARTPCILELALPEVFCDRSGCHLPTTEVVVHYLRRGVVYRHHLMVRLP